MDLALLGHDLGLAMQTPSPEALSGHLHRSVHGVHHQHTSVLSLESGR